MEDALSIQYQLQQLFWRSHCFYTRPIYWSSLSDYSCIAVCFWILEIDSTLEMDFVDLLQCVCQVNLSQLQYISCLGINYEAIVRVAYTFLAGAEVVLILVACFGAKEEFSGHGSWRHPVHMKVLL